MSSCLKTLLECLSRVIQVGVNESRLLGLKIKQIEVAPDFICRDVTRVKDWARWKAGGGGLCSNDVTIPQPSPMNHN